MDTFLTKAIQALPKIATSPLAMFAYLATVGAYVYVALLGVRHKHLLQHLTMLPEKDRLRALESELGEARLRSGMAPEQWLRGRIHRYYLLAFLATCITTIVIVALVLYRTRGTLDIDVTGYRGASLFDGLTKYLALPILVGTAHAAEFEFAKPGNIGSQAVDHQSVVRYEYERKEGKLLIRPSSRLLDAIRKGEQVEGFGFWRQPICVHLSCRLEVTMIYVSTVGLFACKGLAPPAPQLI
jgi:hypothetical protein